MKKKGNFFHKEKDKKENFHKSQEAFKHKPFKNNRILTSPHIFGFKPNRPLHMGGGNLSRGANTWALFKLTGSGQLESMIPYATTRPGP